MQESFRPVGTESVPASARVPNIGVVRRRGIGDPATVIMEIDLIFKIAAIGIIVYCNNGFPGVLVGNSGDGYCVISLKSGNRLHG